MSDNVYEPFCLYNIVEDLRETQDLTKTKPNILQMMLDCYNSHAKESQDRQDQGYHSGSDLSQFAGAVHVSI